MIIVAPTGLYKSILPKNSESGNITYTVSSQDPPRTNVTVLQLPVVEEFKPAPDEIFDEDTRRSVFGEQILTLSQGSRSNPGSNSKTFEVGEILNFEDNPPIEEINTLRAPDDIEIRHDTNLLDLEGIGLSEEEIFDLELLSQQKLRSLQQLYSDKRTDISDLDAEIGENQKKINETNKTIKAVRELFDIPDSVLEFDNDIFTKLNASLIELEEDRDQLIADRNASGTELEDLQKSIVRVSELVR